MNWLTTDLHQLLASLQQALHAAPANPADPFRTAAFITAAGPQPTARTVVLRRTDPDTRQLFFHTDTRSAKLRELAANPRVTWLFYHPLAAIQIRAEGTAAPLPNDASIRAAWLATPAPNRLNYCTTLPPGSSLEHPDASLPAALRQTGPTLQETEFGWPNFTIVATTVTRFEWLLLQPRGARRARFTWENSGWTSQWLVP